MASTIFYCTFVIWKVARAFHFITPFLMLSISHHSRNSSLSAVFFQRVQSVNCEFCEFQRSARHFFNQELKDKS